MPARTSTSRGQFRSLARSLIIPSIFFQFDFSIGADHP